MQDFPTTNETLRTRVFNAFQDRAGSARLDNIRVLDTIIPVFDVSNSVSPTATSTIESVFQQVLSRNTSVVTVSNSNTTTQLTTSPGFYLVKYGYDAFNNASNVEFQLEIQGSGSTVPILRYYPYVDSNGNGNWYHQNGSCFVFVQTSDNLFLKTDGQNAYTVATVSSTQILDVSGNFVSPVGFS
jgi:hypothetical protein